MSKTHVALCLAAIAGFIVVGSLSAANPVSSTDTPAPVASAESKPTSEPSGPFALRINCGGGKFKDARGNMWVFDRPAEGASYGYLGDGGSVDRGEDVKIAKTDLQKVFQAESYGADGYKISVPKKGAYTVALLFAETYDGITAAGERTFDVAINGKKVLVDFDVYKEAGNAGNTAVAKVFDVDVTGTEIKIDFTKKTQNNEINGIVVVEGTGEAAFKAATAGIEGVKPSVKATSTSAPASKPAEAKAEVKALETK